MADFTLSKSLFKGKHRDPSSLTGNIAYAVFVLFCFWAGAQVLNLLAHAPGIYEELMQLQMQETGRPRVEIGLGVGTLFGLIPFLTGCLILGVIAAVVRWRHRHHNDD
ncbi:TPA: YaiY family protein [Citrobacter pasteurii]|uniref:YaiY family protein n=1 Tax=Citrobacter sp. Cu233 TaxID=2985160 RepID=UPI002577A0C1|nr:YaiY family protein [Citrobacter sp. Cu233]MDM2932834.1 YaiY family protein [Citrobacter sp. Cu233]